MQAIELNAEVTNNHELHIKLPDAVAAGTVRVIVLYGQDQDLPVPKGKRRFGQFRGEITIADDFDAPLPDEFWHGDKT